MTTMKIKSGKDQANYRAITKLVNPSGNYKLSFDYIFGNKNIVKKENGLICSYNGSK